jgi:hypothetical protein
MAENDKRPGVLDGGHEFRLERALLGEEKRKLVQIQIIHDEFSRTQHWIRIQFQYSDGSAEINQAEFFTSTDEMIEFLEAVKAQVGPKAQAEIDRIVEAARK